MIAADGSKSISALEVVALLQGIVTFLFIAPNFEQKTPDLFSAAFRSVGVNKER